METSECITSQKQCPSKCNVGGSNYPNVLNDKCHLTCQANEIVHIELIIQNCHVKLSNHALRLNTDSKHK